MTTFVSESTAKKMMKAYKAYIIADAACEPNVEELWVAYKAAEREHLVAIA